MSTRDILRADVRQYWNKYIRFHPLRIGLFVLGAYALLVIGIFRDSGPILVGLSLPSRLVLYIFLTVVVTVSDVWTKSVKYLLVRPETRLLRQFQVPVWTLVKCFTGLTMFVGLPAGIAYTITFSLTPRHSIQLFLLLFAVRVLTVVSMTWATVLVCVVLQRYHLAWFVGGELLLKVLNYTVSLGVIITLLLHHHEAFTFVAARLSEWRLVGEVSGAVLLTGVLSWWGLHSRWYHGRFRDAVAHEGNARSPRKAARSRRIPYHRILAIMAKDTYSPLGTGYLWRLALFTGLVVLLRFIQLDTLTLSHRLVFVVQWLLGGRQVVWFSLWLGLLFFLEPCATLFQDEESSARMYTRLGVPLRQVLLAKWLFAVTAVTLPISLCLLINHAWFHSGVQVWNGVFVMITVCQIATCVVVLSSLFIATGRGIHLSRPVLSQVPQVPSATVAMTFGLIDATLSTSLVKGVGALGGLILQGISFVAVFALYLSVWPRWLQKWSRRL